MTSIYEINDIVNFLHKHKITAEQFMYCLLLYHDKRHSRLNGTNKISRPLSQLYKYHNSVNKFSREDIEDLISKGFIKKDGKSLAPDMLEVTNKFEKEYLGDKYKFDQLAEAYPHWVDNFDHPSKGKIKLKNYKDYQGTVNLYNKLVKTNKMHERVVSLVEWARGQGLINMNIEYFVSSKGWEALQELRDSGEHSDNYEVI